MKYDNVKAKVFPILLFLWLSPPVPTVSFQTLQINFFFMTIFLQYIKRLLDLSTPNSQIILNTSLENNPLSHKLPFLKPQSFWHVYSQRCYFHLFIYWQKCPQLVRGINKIDMVWEKESIQFIYIIFFLWQKKCSKYECPLNNYTFHTPALSQHKVMWEFCRFPSIIKYQSTSQLTTWSKYWSNKSNKFVLTYQEDIPPIIYVYAYCFIQKMYVWGRAITSLYMILKI